MFRSPFLFCRALLILYVTLHVCVSAADQNVLAGSPRKGYVKGDVVPVSCLNRTIDTGEHIVDAHGNLQYIPFMTCSETQQPLSFTYNHPTTQNCTIDTMTDELYHLFEYFVHSDVPLSCRVPSYPLSSTDVFSSSPSGDDSEKWTPFTIALQGSLQLSHLHLQTHINALFHTAPDEDWSLDKKSRKGNAKDTSHLIASAAYSLPAPRSPGSAQSSVQSSDLNLEGAKIVRNEPLVLTFNVGWIEGAVLPGMVGKPVMKLTDHNVGFSLLSFFAIFGAAGTGALGMLVYERRKSGRSMNGLLPVSSGANGAAIRGGYGGYGGYTSGKRD